MCRILSFFALPLEPGVLWNQEPCLWSQDFLALQGRLSVDRPFRLYWYEHAVLTVLTLVFPAGETAGYENRSMNMTSKIRDVFHSPCLCLAFSGNLDLWTTHVLPSENSLLQRKEAVNPSSYLTQRLANSEKQNDSGRDFFVYHSH